MDYSMDFMDNRSTPMRGDELTPAELDAVAGGTNSSYDVFYTLGYWTGEAVAWVSDVLTAHNRYTAQSVLQSNGAILAYF